MATLRRNSKALAIKADHIPEVTPEKWKEAQTILASHIGDVANDKILFSGGLGVSVKYTGERFDGLSMKRVNLIDGVFENCSFLKVAAAGSEFRNCTFRDCDFTGSNFQFANFTNSALTSSDLTNKINSDYKTIIAGANFSAVNFSSTKLLSINAEGSSFVNSIFSNAEIKNCYIAYSSFEGAKFDGAVIEDVDFSNINIEYVDFSNATFRNVTVPIMQLAYSFGGLEYLLTKEGLRVRTKHKSFFDGLMDNGAYLQLLPHLETYFLKMQEYFPLANIYLATNRISYFKEAITLGVKLSIVQKEIRLLKFYSQLARKSNVFTAGQLFSLYNQVRNLITHNINDPVLLHQYTIHRGEIEQSLIAQEDALIHVQFVSNNLDYISLDPISKVAKLITIGLGIINIQVELKTVNLTKNSPIQVVLDFITKDPSTVKIALVGIGYFLKGSGELFEQLKKMLSNKKDKKISSLEKKLRAVQKQLLAMELKMSNINIYIQPSSKAIRGNERKKLTA